MLHKRVPCREQEQCLFLTAVENTWIHGRQKRREQKRQLRELPRAPHCAGTSSRTSSQTSVASASPTTTPASTQTNNSADDSSENKATSAHELAGQQQPAEQTGNGSSSNETSKHNIPGEHKEVVERVTDEDVDMESTCTGAGQEIGQKETPAAASEPPSKRPLSPGSVEHFLFKCLLNVMPEESDVVIEMHWVEGHNKDLMNQLCTYLKNTLLKYVIKS